MLDLSNYNDENVFAKILRKELPSTAVFESEHSYAFKDINPVAPVHVLLISKGRYTCMQDFLEHAAPKEQADFWHSLADIAHKLGLRETGYRIVSNVGSQAGQEVPHFHVHIISGRRLDAKC